MVETINSESAAPRGLRAGWLRRLSTLSAAASGLAVSALALYVFWNGSGHTGFDPYRLLWICVPSLLVGALSCAAEASRKQLSRPGLLAALAGGIGIAFLVVIDRADILLPYETWLQRGMP